MFSVKSVLMKLLSFLFIVSLLLLLSKSLLNARKEATAFDENRWQFNELSPTVLFTKHPGEEDYDGKSFTF